MERLQELEVDREDRRTQIKDLLAKAGKDKRTLTEDEQVTSGQLRQDLERIEATIKLEREALNWDRNDAPAVGAPPADGPARKHPKPYARNLGGSKNPWGDCSTEMGLQEAFGTFLQAVREAGCGGAVDPRLSMIPTASASGMSTSVGSEGGHLVRTDFSTALLDKAMDEAVLAPRCTTIEVGENADGIELPYVDETSRANGSRWGGVQVYRRAEADTVNASKPKLGTFEIRLEDLMGICYATDRAMRDAVSLGQIIQMAFASECAFKVDDEIVRGTGSGQCLGILNSSAKVQVAKETSQPANTVLAANVIKMRSRLRPRSRPRAAWYINQEVESQLPLMTVPVKNVAGSENVGGAPVYVPAGGLSGAPFDTLYNRPVIPIEQAEGLSTEGDIMLLDLSEYLLIRKGALETAQSIHVRFLYGENTFRFTYRINGAPAWKTALTPYKGTTTQSPFITLQSR